jgi:RNA polymerase sigma factor (sigma-70 family)
MTADVDPTSWRDTAALFEAARAGDRAPMNELVATLSPLLWHVARSEGLDRELSQDVVQTTWLHLVKDMHTIRDPRAVVAWLITTTKRECWRVRAKHGHESLLEDQQVEEPAAPDPSPEEIVLRDDARRRLWRALEQLSERCRLLLRVVAFVPRPDYRVLAESLGMAKGGIGPTRGRCLAKLRALLDADEEGARP